MPIVTSKYILEFDRKLTANKFQNLFLHLMHTLNRNPKIDYFFFLFVPLSLLNIQFKVFDLFDKNA